MRPVLEDAPPSRPGLPGQLNDSAG